MPGGSYVDDSWWSAKVGGTVFGRREGNNRSGAFALPVVRVLLMAVFAMLVGACGSSASVETVADGASAAVSDAGDAAQDAATDVLEDVADEVEDVADEVAEAASPDVSEDVVVDGGAQAARADVVQGQSVVEPADEFVSVDLFEWGLTAPAEAPAGAQSYVVANTGDFKHELAIARGASYETLPQLANGAVDEDALGDAFIGRTETFAGGKTIEVLFDLEPGEYVFYCNISVGPNSHAANGQVASVVVG